MGAALRDADISEISFQPPQTRRARTRRTKRLAVNSSRPGCAVGGKSKPSSTWTQSPGYARHDSHATRDGLLNVRSHIQRVLPQPSHLQQHVADEKRVVDKVAV